MRVLVGCEYSGRVRQAFRKRGHDAWSCDMFEPAEDDSPFHYREDVLKIIANEQWDLMVCHPPCTHLAVSGARWWATKPPELQQEAIQLCLDLMAAPIEKIAMENPIGLLSSRYRKPDQIIQPWQFGHGETKATCLWLKNLPLLKPTDIVSGRENKVHKMPPGPNRWKERSRTYLGIAEAMAAQWGGDERDEAFS